MSDTQREDLHYAEKTIGSTAEFVTFIEQLLSIDNDCVIIFFAGDTQVCIKVTDAVDIKEVRERIFENFLVNYILKDLKGGD